MKHHVTKSANVVQKHQLRLVRIRSSGWFTTVRIMWRSWWMLKYQDNAVAAQLW